MSKITQQDLHGMVGHWLTTPVNGYLGSDYGQDVRTLLQQPLEVAADNAADVLDKLRSDVPLLQALPKGALNLYGVPVDPDRLHLFIEVAGQAIEVKDQ